MRKRERRESSQVPSKNGPSDSRQCQNRKPEREKKIKSNKCEGAKKERVKLGFLPWCRAAIPC